MEGTELNLDITKWEAFRLRGDKGNNILLKCDANLMSKDGSSSGRRFR